MLPVGEFDAVVSTLDERDTMGKPKVRRKNPRISDGSPAMFPAKPISWRFNSAERKFERYDAPPPWQDGRRRKEEGGTPAVRGLTSETRREKRGLVEGCKFRESGKFDDRGSGTTVRSSRASAYSRQFDSGRDTSP